MFCRKQNKTTHKREYEDNSSSKHAIRDRSPLEMYVFQIALKGYIFNILPLFQHGMSITLNRQSKCISVAGSRDESNKRGHKLIRNKSPGMK